MRRRTVLTFLATALAGLVVSARSTTRVMMTLFGPPAFSPLFDFLISDFGLPLIVVAGVAGYISPRRFWLWGLAAVCLRPVVIVLSTLPAVRVGVIGPSDYLGLVVVYAMFLSMLAALCTAGSGAGVGLRLLVERILRRRSEGTPQAASPPEAPSGATDAEEFDISEPVRSLTRTVRAVLLKPTGFFRGVTSRGNLANPLVFALVCILISFALAIIFNQVDLDTEVGLDAGGVPAYIMAVLVTLTVPVLVALYVYIVAGVYHLFVILFVRRSNAGFEATFKASAYAAAIALLTWIPVVGFLLRFYGLYLSIVGIRELHSTTTARAAAVVLIPASVALLIVLSLILSVSGVDALLRI